MARCGVPTGGATNVDGGLGVVGRGLWAVTTGAALQTGQGGHVTAPDMTGGGNGIGSAAIVVADDETRAALPDGSPHVPLSQTRSPLQSVSFRQPSAPSPLGCEQEATALRKTTTLSRPPCRLARRPSSHASPGLAC